METLEKQNDPTAIQPRQSLKATDISAQQIVEALEGEQQDNGSWLARCVFSENHTNGDEHPSLVITETEDGTTLVHCRAGCDQKKVFSAVLAKAMDSDSSLEPEDEFAEDLPIHLACVNKFVRQLEGRPDAQAWLKSRGISLETARSLQFGCEDCRFGEESKSPAIMTPHYVKGKLVGVKARRMHPKDFSQVPGSSIDGLYAAHILDAGSSEVYVFEGEADTALAKSHGFNATGILCANSKLASHDISILSRYRRIYLIGDQDIAGKNAMDSLQARLPVGKVIRVRLRGYKDIGELYAKDSARFETNLRGYVRMAQSSREFFEMEDLMTENDLRDGQSEVVPHIVEELIPANSITMLFGEEKSGKSLLATYILKCVANGVKVFDVLPVSKRPVLYLDLENSANEIAGFTEHFKRLGGAPIRYLSRVTGCPELDSPWLIQFCEKHQPLLVLDSLTKFLMGADPFHPGEISEFFDKVLNLCAAGATVIIIHHSTKADNEQYADSHQIGANVSRAYCVISEERPKLHRVRLEAKLCRGAEPSSFDLIAFPVISNHGCFGIADKTETDVDKVVEWMKENKPDGCLLKDIKGMRASRIPAAVKEALKVDRLTEDPGTHILRVPTSGNLDSYVMEFREPGTKGTEQLEGELISF
jgi:archaellum biogenesis ATPase FlaH/5S rRNA maturation endonuclease (ribonuclease M5)